MCGETNTHSYLHTQGGGGGDTERRESDFKNNDIPSLYLHTNQFKSLVADKCYTNSWLFSVVTAAALQGNRDLGL